MRAASHGRCTCQQTSRCRSPPPASARAELVNRARDDFLASPGLARHEKQITRPHLRRGEQPRNRTDYIALDGALQVACSISLVRALLQQEQPCFVRYPKLEGTRRTIRYALLHLPQFNVRHFIKFVALQRMERHHFVQAVHKLGGKLPPCRFYRRPLHLLV